MDISDGDHKRGRKQYSKVHTCKIQVTRIRIGMMKQQNYLPVEDLAKSHS